DVDRPHAEARGLFRRGECQPVARRDDRGQLRHVALRGTSMDGSIRFAYFLCTAWRLTPRPSATCCQVIPARRPASTWRFSRASVSVRSDATARSPAAGSAVSEAACARRVEFMVSTYVACGEVST